MMFLLRLFLMIQSFVSLLSADENEFRLTKYLLADYDKSVRPSRNASEPMNVTFGLALTQIIDVDERNQILTTNCWLNQMWIDYSLQWNASSFGGIRVIRLPADTVWKPDIILYNNADSQYNNAILSTNVIVVSDGNLTWLSSAIFKSSCKIDVSWFPFDEQTCTMKFASWTYDGYQVNLVIQTTEGDLSNYVENGEWDLIRMVVQRNEVFYSCCQEPYPDITYSIILRRRPLFYVFNLILPCVLITGIALLSFYMPSDSGEKVTLGITTLLSMTVFLMVIGESMPPTSDTVPLIGLYYGVTISLVSLTTALSVVTLNIHHRGTRGTEVPHYVKKIVFGALAKILFINIDTVSDAQYVHSGKKYERPPVETITEIEKCENGNLTQALASEYIQGVIRGVAPTIDPLERHFIRVLNKVYQTIENNEVRSAEQDRRNTIKLEWQQVAVVIDRFLLWVFILLTVGTTFGILSLSPHARLY